MQEQIHIHPDLAIREEFQELRVVELRLQQIIQRYLRARSRHRYRPVASLDAEDADLITGDGKVDFIPLTLAVSLPGHEYTAVGKILGGVLEGAKLRHPTGTLEFALMVPLLGERHQEAFLAFLVLESHHGLLDVVVVRFELLFQIRRLVSEASERKTDSLEFFVTLNASTMFGAYVDCDSIQQILVVVVAGETAILLEVEDVLESGALELGITHRDNVRDGTGFRVSATFVTPS